MDDFRLQPVKASLIADLVELINVNLAELLRPSTITCPVCKGRGTVGGETHWNGKTEEIVVDGTLSTCASCGGVGAVERYDIDMERLKTYRFGRLIEGFDVKQGQLVPKMRSKDKAFATLVKLLGYDKAIVEIANGAAFAETISDDERGAYVEQLKQMAAMGLLDGGAS
jgi:RecJ-like exonuclease